MPRCFSFSWFRFFWIVAATGLLWPDLSAAAGLSEARKSQQGASPDSSAGAGIEPVSVSDATGIALFQEGVPIEGNNFTIKAQVSASFGGSLTYQWLRNGYVMPGETASTLSFSPISRLHDGIYEVDVSDGTKSVRSGRNPLRVYPRAQIRYMPTLHKMVRGTFGRVPYLLDIDNQTRTEWLFKGVPLAFGSNTPDYSLPADDAHAGAYTLRVTDAEGRVSEASTEVIIVDDVFNFESMDVPVQGGSYVIRSEKKAAGTPQCEADWVQLKTSGESSQGFLISVLPNGSGIDRQTHVVVDGRTHQISQAGSKRSLPSLWMFGSTFPTITSGAPIKESDVLLLSAQAHCADLGWQTLYFVDGQGTLFGLGRTADSELGYSDYLDATAPRRIHEKVKAVSAASMHCHFITEDGVLWYVGDNNNEVAGFFGRARGATPFPIADHVVAVTTNDYFTIYLRDDGVVWGASNPYSVLGRSDGIGNGTPWIIARDIKAIASDYTQALLLKKDGTILETGISSGGGSTVSLSEVALSQPVRAIAVGNGAAFCITETDDLYGFGRNENGQLGLGHTKNVGLPTLISSGVNEVCAKNGATFFTKKDGMLWFCGNNSRWNFPGATGLVQATPRALAANVTKLFCGLFLSDKSPELFRVVQAPQTAYVAKGGDVNLSITVDGFGPFSYQWYRNGELIPGATESTYTVGKVSLSSQAQYLVEVTGPGVKYASNAVQVYVSAAPELVASNLSVSDIEGSQQLLWAKASGSPSPRYQWRKNGQPITGATNFYFRIDALSKSDEGDYDVVITNAVGQLITPAGSVKMVDLALSVSSKELGPSIGAYALQVSAKNSWAAQCDADWVRLSTRYGFGSAALEVFVLANETGTDRSTTLRIGSQTHTLTQRASFTGLKEAWFLGRQGLKPAPKSPLSHLGSRVKSISSTGSQTVILEEDGRLYGVGLGVHGAPHLSGNPLTRSLWAENVSSFSASPYILSWIRQDGTLWITGTFQSCGYDLANTWAMPTSTPFCYGENVTDVWACDTHVLFRKSDGTLWAAGGNIYGQTGLRAPRTDYLPRLLDTEVATAAVANNRSYYVKTNGELWVLGNNSDGSLGLSDFSSITSKTKVATDVAAVSAGTSNAAYLKRDGSVWSTAYSEALESSPGCGVMNGRWRCIAQDAKAVQALNASTLYLKKDGSAWQTGVSIEVSGIPTVPRCVAINCDTLQQITEGAGFLSKDSIHVFRVLCPPVDAYARDGESAFFWTVVAGAKSPVYRWLLNGAAKTDKAGSTLEIARVTKASNAIVGVEIVDGTETRFGYGARLQVLQAPSFVTDVPDSVLAQGESGRLRFRYNAVPSATFSWKKNGVAIEDSNYETLYLSGSATTGEDRYEVVLSNAEGSVTSRSITVKTVLAKFSPAGDVVGEGSTRCFVNVTTKGAWKAQCSASWVSLLPQSGEGNGGINLYVAENESSEDRSAIISIGGSSYTLIQRGRGRSPLQLWQVPPLNYTDSISLVGSGLRKVLGNYAILDSGELVNLTEYKSVRDVTGTTVAPIIARDVADFGVTNANFFFLTKDGELWGWGPNEGLLGDGSTMRRDQPVFLADGVSSMSTGGGTVYYIRKDGSLWGFGANQSGMLGNRNVFGIIPYPLHLADNVKQVSSSSTHALFVDKNGGLWGLGSNFNGEISAGGPSKVSSPVKIRDRVVAAGAGSGLSVFLTEEGGLGQVGASSLFVAAEVQDFVQGDSYTVYRKRDGSVWYTKPSGGLPQKVDLGAQIETYGKDWMVCRGGSGGYYLVPQVVDAPTELSFARGGWFNINVNFTHAVGLSYQWYKDGVELKGMNLYYLYYDKMDESMTGTYTLVVTTPLGIKVSHSVKVSMTSSRLSAISVRARAGSGDKTLMVGLITGGSERMPLLVRAIGPNLEKLVDDYMRDPRLIVYDASGGRMVDNDNWVDSAELRQRFAAAGMVPLPQGSRDAAMPLDLEQDLVSMHVAASDAKDGIALAEVYEAGTLKGTRRIKAISVRNQVGSGNDVLIAGFVVTGDGNLRVLIRGLGPALTGAVSNPLEDPVIRIHNALTGALVAENDDWGSNEEAKMAMDKLGFPRLASNSKDAAYGGFLAPGVYTVTLSGKNDGTGVGLIEVYEVQ